MEEEWGCGESWEKDVDGHNKANWELERKGGCETERKKLGTEYEGELRQRGTGWRGWRMEKLRSERGLLRDWEKGGRQQKGLESWGQKIDWGRVKGKTSEQIGRVIRDWEDGERQNGRSSERARRGLRRRKSLLWHNKKGQTGWQKG